MTYDTSSKQWTVIWNWRDGMEPSRLFNTVSEYKVSKEARQEYENELMQWIADKWK